MTNNHQFKLLKTIAQGFLALCFITFLFQGTDIVYTFHKNEETTVIESNEAEVSVEKSNTEPLIKLDHIVFYIVNNYEVDVYDDITEYEIVYHEVRTLPLGSRAPEKNPTC